MKPTTAENPIRPEVLQLKMALVAQLMSVKALAEKSGVSVSMIHYIFSGERMPTIAIFDRLAKALGVTVPIGRNGKRGQQPAKRMV